MSELYRFTYFDANKEPQVITVEADTHEEAVELAVARLLERDPLS